MSANDEERGLKFTLPKMSARLSVSFEKKNAGLSVPPRVSGISKNDAFKKLLKRKSSWFIQLI